MIIIIQSKLKVFSPYYKVQYKMSYELLGIRDNFGYNNNPKIGIQ